MKILWFVGLKIVEVLTIVFGPHYLGKWVHTWQWSDGLFCDHTPKCDPMWLVGFGAMCITIVIALVIAAVVLLLMANWSWATMLHKKFRK